MVAIARVPKPLGLILEERDGGGARVARIDPRGNVIALRADVLINDVVLMVGDERCDDRLFDDVMALIADAQGVVELTLARGPARVRVEWPNGVGVAAEAGERLKPLATAALVPVTYSCDNGSCGTCEHKIRDVETGKERYARVCVARVPKASSIRILVRYGRQQQHQSLQRERLPGGRGLPNQNEYGSGMTRRPFAKRTGVGYGLNFGTSRCLQTV